MNEIISGQDIWKVYDGQGRRTEVLKGVSFDVDRPGVAAIVGPSGAGKTTLLNILSGLDVPTRGRVFVKGHEWSRMSVSRRQRFMNASVGFVFQFYHLLSDLTALENVMLPARIYGRLHRREATERARKLLDIMGLAERARHYPAALSGGESQRVAIARAIMNDPEILFCDEPTGNLDTEAGHDVCAYLKSLAVRQHKTVLIVTHDDKIAKLADEVYHLQDGKWA